MKPTGVLPPSGSPIKLNDGWESHIKPTGGLPPSGSPIKLNDGWESHIKPTGALPPSVSPILNPLVVCPHLGVPY